MTSSNGTLGGWSIRQRFTRRTRRGLLGATVAGALLAACGTPPVGGQSQKEDASAAQSGEAIRVGAVISLTGRYAPFGEHIKNAYDLAVEDVNRDGGVDAGGRKRRLELLVLDDESDPT